MSGYTPVRVIAFPGAPNLPTFAAMELGFFAARGVEVALEMTTCPPDPPPEPPPIRP